MSYDYVVDDDEYIEEDSMDSSSRHQDEDSEMEEYKEKVFNIKVKLHIPKSLWIEILETEGIWRDENCHNSWEKLQMLQILSTAISVSSDKNNCKL